MASSLLALLDDIATLLDDVAVMTKVAARQGVAAADDVAVLSKVAAQKTAGVLGDDLALNAQQVSGVVSSRELPVVWAVAKGSFLNKLILVPAALIISAVAPRAVVPLLMIGGLYLCYEGCEKLAHHFLHRGHKSPAAAGAELAKLAATPPEMVKESEADKIRGAVRTDFVLSAEIIAITLGTVAGQDFTRQVLVLSAIALVMTVGVYGLVAGIVKLDDAGLFLSQRRQAVAQAVGRGLLWGAPYLMKTLSILGTAAMFLVGGGIVTHGIPRLHRWVEHTAEWMAQAGGGLAGVLASLGGAVLSGLCGMVAGCRVLLAAAGVRRLRGSRPETADS